MRASKRDGADTAGPGEQARNVWRAHDVRNHGSGRLRGGRRTQRGEEPSVLAARVALLQDLLHVLLGIFPLADLLEGIGGQGALETLKLECVTGGHQVVVVDGLDERLDLGALLLAGLGHPAGDLGGVSLNAGDQGVTIRVGLVTRVDRLNDDNLKVKKRSRVRTGLPFLNHACNCAQSFSAQKRINWTSTISSSCDSRFWCGRVKNGSSHASVHPSQCPFPCFLVLVPGFVQLYLRVSKKFAATSRDLYVPFYRRSGRG